MYVGDLNKARKMPWIFNKYYRLPAVKSSGLHFKSDCLYTIIE